MAVDNRKKDGKVFKSNVNFIIPAKKAIFKVLSNHVSGCGEFTIDTTRPTPIIAIAIDINLNAHIAHCHIGYASGYR